MCGEYEFSGLLVERFAGYHRQELRRLQGLAWAMLIGAAALAADYNGASKASHVKDKLIEMIHRTKRFSPAASPARRRDIRRRRNLPD